MTEIQDVLAYFVVPKSGNQAWKEYSKDNPNGVSRGTFFNRIQTLVNRNDLRWTTDGYERTKKAADFWSFLYAFSDFLESQEHERMTRQYVANVVGNHDPEAFIKELRKVVDETKFLEMAEFIKTLYEKPKIGLSHLEMYFQIHDADGSTRASWLQALQD